jgi:hypothetical protein
MAKRTIQSAQARRAGKAGRLSKDDRECAQLVSRIRAELAEIEKAETQIAQRYAALGKYLQFEPDVRISRIRLSDWLHLEAHDGRQLKGLKPKLVPWAAYLKDRGVPLRQSQADLYIRVHQGRTTTEAVRDQIRARVLKHRSALQNAEPTIDYQGETGVEQPEQETTVHAIVEQRKQPEQVTVRPYSVPADQVKTLEWPSHERTSESSNEPPEYDSIVHRVGATRVDKVGATLDEILAKDEILANSSVKPNELSGLGTYLRIEFDEWQAKIRQAIDSRTTDRVEPTDPAVPPQLH